MVSDVIDPAEELPETSAEMVVARPPLLNDGEIRELLLERLHDRHASESDVAFVEELGLCRGQVRVDVAVVNGSIHGYEIKSERDSLRRLTRQVVVYGHVLDRACLVVATKHADDAMVAVPPWWEIQVAHRTAAGLRLKRIRAGRKNPARNPRALVELLWLDDALALLEARGGLRGFRSRPRGEIWDRICELYTVDEIGDAVRRQIKARTARRSSQLRG